MVTRRLILLFFLLSAFTAGPASADDGDHWCRAHFDWSARSYIPVWLHPDLASYLHHPDGTVWTTDELAQEIRLIISKFEDQAPSNMPPIRYMGTEYAGTAWNGPAGNGPGGTPGAWNIAFRPKLDVVDQYTVCSTETWPWPYMTSTGQLILVATSTPPCVREQFGYAHWVYPSGQTGQNGVTSEVLGGTLMHELMHALGYAHEDACQSGGLQPCADNPGEPQVCGVMTTTGISSEYYDTEYADWDAFSTVYGNWASDGDYRLQSTDTHTWTVLVDTSVASGPMWVSGWPIASGFLPIMTTDASTLFPRFYRWNVTSHAFQDFGVPYPAGQFGRVAIGVGAGFYYLWFISAQAEDVTQKHLGYAWYTSSRLAQPVRGGTSPINMHPVKEWAALMIRNPEC